MSSEWTVARAMDTLSEARRYIPSEVVRDALREAQDFLRTQLSHPQAASSTQAGEWIADLSDNDLRDIFNYRPDLAARIRNAITSSTTPASGQQPQGGEYVAVIVQGPNEDYPRKTRWVAPKPPVGTKLYTTPPATRAPGDERVAALCEAIADNRGLNVIRQMAAAICPPPAAQEGAQGERGAGE